MEFTLGIEEEYQVIDPKTWDLSYDQDIVAAAGDKFGEMIKVEMHKSCVETGTKILEDIKEARKEVTFLRQTVYDLAKSYGLTIGAAGTHPFTKWEEALITDHPRYKEIVEELQDAARSNLIFGLHVHVGIEDKEMAIHIANQIRYFLPHIFALSTNSPFWDGRNTGFRSYRTKVFDKFPRTGIPPYFTSSAEYFRFIDTLVKTNSIDNAKKIWWDLRVHPFYPTIEIRICDVPLTIDETVCMAALVQATVVKLYRLRQQNQGFISYNRALIAENKWRACRWGINGKMIDFGKQEEFETKDLLEEFLGFIDDVVDDLGSREEVEYTREIMANGTGADRQLKVFEDTNSLEEVAKYIVGESTKGLKL